MTKKRLPLSRLFTIICIVSFLVLGQTSITYADIFDNGVAPGETFSTNPKERTNTVTASVRDRIPPSIPILVSPENNSTVAHVPFAFIWKSSNDDYGIEKYQLYIDGNIYQDDITSSISGYSEASGNISWTPSSIIADGSHTWKIRAYDNNGNYSDSTTWVFVVDTTAPTLVITSIGSVTVSITNQDATTIPTSPILLKKNNPVVIGKTDANITVVVTINFPDGKTQTVETITDDQGAFEVILPTLPKSKVITLDIQTQDGVGNIAIISGVPIKIIPTYIPLPPPIEEVIPPIEQPPTPEEIKEIVKQIVQQPITSNLPYKQAKQILGIFPILALLVGLLLPTVALLCTVIQSGVGIQEFGLQFILAALRAIGLLPPPEERGIVFDSKTRKPIAYAYIQVIRVKDYKVVATTMSNKHGIFGNASLEPGEYVVRVFHRYYTFPTSLEKSRFLRIEEFYKGEIFQTHQFQCLPPLYIPMDRRENKNTDTSPSPRILRFEAWISSTPTPLVIPITILIAVVTVAFPSIWNISMAILYFYTLAKRTYRHSLTPLCRGTVEDNGHTALSCAFILFEKEHSNTAVFAQTDEFGYFEAFSSYGKYEITITHPEYAQLTQEVDLRTKETLLLTVPQK